MANDFLENSAFSRKHEKSPTKVGLFCFISGEAAYLLLASTSCTLSTGTISSLKV